MRYHIAVCDDSGADAAYVRALTEDWAARTGHTVQLEIFPSAESFLFHYAEDKSYDILLLDIEMTGMDGVALARQVRRDNESVQIIFITGYSDYIAEGYDVAALHYLVKPVSREKLHEILDRAARKLGKNERALLLGLAGEAVRVPLYQIRYLEVRQNYVTIHAKEDYTVKRSLGEFARELDDRFYRMGRSYIVNLTCICRVTRTDVYLSDGSVIPLPRGQYEPLNRAIIART